MQPFPGAAKLCKIGIRQKTHAFQSLVQRSRGMVGGPKLGLHVDGSRNQRKAKGRNIWEPTTIQSGAGPIID